MILYYKRQALFILLFPWEKKHKAMQNKKVPSFVWFGLVFTLEFSAFMQAPRQNALLFGSIETTWYILMCMWQIYFFMIKKNL